MRITLDGVVFEARQAIAPGHSAQVIHQGVCDAVNKRTAVADLNTKITTTWIYHYFQCAAVDPSPLLRFSLPA